VLIGDGEMLLCPCRTHQEPRACCWVPAWPIVVVPLWCR